MKKRIIALILAVVMCVLALTSCGEYNYSKADLDDCTVVKLDELRAALLALSIKDGEFSADEEERKKNTEDMIYRTLAQSVIADKYVPTSTDKKYDEIDLVYYAYYVTAELGAEGEKKTYVFDFDFKYIDKSVTDENTNNEKTATTSMILTEANGYKYLPYAQAGLNDNEENPLDKAVLEAFKDVESYDYDVETTTDTKVKAGDFVLVSFTYTLTDTAGNKTTVTVADLPLTVPAADATDYEVPAYVSAKGLKEFDVFAKKLSEKYDTTGEQKVSVNNEVSSFYTTPAAADGTAIDKVEYSKVKVTAVVSGTKTELPGITKYSAEYLEKQNKNVTDESAKMTGKFKDVFGDEHDLTGVALTYHVFPAFVVDVKYDVESVINDFYGAAISKDALDIFASETYKFNGTDDQGAAVVYTVKELIEKLAKEQTTFDTKKDAYGKALDEYNKLIEDKAKADEKLAAESTKLENQKTDVANKLADKEAKYAALTAAQAAEKAASDALEAAKATGIQDNITAANTAYEAAKTATTAANTAYTEATTAHESAVKSQEQYQALYDAAKKTVDDLGPKITTAKETLEGKAAEGETAAKVGAKKEYEDAKAARDNVLEYIFSATGGEGARAIKEVILEEFWNFVYETAELDYFNEISASLAKEIAALFKEYIEVISDELPRKAVNEVYEKLYEEHKRKFFLSASLGTETAEYTTFGGDFEKYLMSKTGTESYSDAKAALKTEARGYVATVVRIYRAAQVLDLVYTDAEFKEDHDKSEYNYKYREDYEAYVQYMAQMYAGYGLSAYYYDAEDMATKQDIKTAEQLNKLFDGLLSCELNEDGAPVFDKTTKKFKYNSGLIAYTIEG